MRLLRLLSLLQSGRRWSGVELADRLTVTSRTVRYDMERLRSLGYVVHSSTGRGGGYQLAAGSSLPPLLLDDDEAIAVVIGLRAAAAGTVTGIEEASLRAMVKLEQTLPSRLHHRVKALRSATLSAAQRGPTVGPDILWTIAAAVERSERLRFDYIDYNGDHTTRDVEPLQLVYTGYRWYLIAWDVHHPAWRTFRADRITPRIPSGPRFTPREPPEPDLVAYTLRGTGSQGWTYSARVRLHAPGPAIAEAITPAAGTLTVVNEHTCILETGANSLLDLAGFLLSFDVAFDVLEPPGLRDVLQNLSRRFSDAAR